MFALSTYHLQQCVEKATKAYLIGMGMGTVEEVIGIGHDSLQGHLLYAKKLLPMLADIDPKLNLILSQVEELDAKRLEIARWSSAKVEGELRTFGEVDRVLQAMIPQMMKLAWNVIGPQLPNMQDSPRLTQRSLDKQMKRAVPLLQAPQFLFIASLLTFPHESFTRYPDGAIKPGEYTKSMGVVAHTPELIRRMERALRAMCHLWI